MFGAFPFGGSYLGQGPALTPIIVVGAFPLADVIVQVRSDDAVFAVRSDDLVVQVQSDDDAVTP